MKLPKSVPIKETTSLFSNKYNYKIVLICSAAGWFRNKNYDHALSKLNEVTLLQYSNKWTRIKTEDDLKFHFKLLHTLEKFDQSLYDSRIETPRISIYTNETKYIEQLVSLDEDSIKVIYVPNSKLKQLEPGTIIVKRLDYGYKVHLGTIRNRNHREFIQWAKNSNKIRLTRRCIADLTRNTSWGGSYFYVKDEKTLTMVKVFLGTDISRIEKIIKS